MSGFKIVCGIRNFCFLMALIFNVSQAANAGNSVAVKDIAEKNLVGKMFSSKMKLGKYLLNSRDIVTIDVELEWFVCDVMALDHKFGGFDRVNVELRLSQIAKNSVREAGRRSETVDELASSSKEIFRSIERASEEYGVCVKELEILRAVSQTHISHVYD